MSITQMGRFQLLSHIYRQYPTGNRGRDLKFGSMTRDQLIAWLREQERA
jgi:hypothetical protein